MKGRAWLLSAVFHLARSFKSQRHKNMLRSVEGPEPASFSFHFLNSSFFSSIKSIWTWRSQSFHQWFLCSVFIYLFHLWFLQIIRYSWKTLDEKVSLHFPFSCPSDTLVISLPPVLYCSWWQPPNDARRSRTTRPRGPGQLSGTESSQEPDRNSPGSGSDASVAEAPRKCIFIFVPESNS